MPDRIPSRFFAGEEHGWPTTEDTSRVSDLELMKLLERSRDRGKRFAAVPKHVLMVRKTGYRLVRDPRK